MENLNLRTPALIYIEEPSKIIKKNDIKMGVSGATIYSLLKGHCRSRRIGVSPQIMMRMREVASLSGVGDHEDGGRPSHPLVAPSEGSEPCPKFL